MRDLSWKTLASEYVYNDRWFIARKDKCQMPDGKIVEPYYVMEFPNWCNVVVLTEDEKIVLVRQYRHAINLTTLELPGGVIDKGETPEQAALREIQEETGYQVNELELLYTTSPNPATNNNTAYLYLAKNAKPILSQNFDYFEDMDVLLFSKGEIRQMLVENKFMHGVQIGALYAAFERLGWMKW